MARWVIVNLSDNSVAAEYHSERAEIGTDRFGGSWDDPSRSAHLKVPTELDGIKLSDLECLFEENGHLLNEAGSPRFQPQLLQVANERVMVKAYDGAGEPIWNQDGTQAELPVYQRVPITGPTRKLRRRS